MRLALHIGFWVFCSTAPTTSVMAQSSATSGIYTCTDATGRRITADRPIPQCADREQRVLGPSGVERKRIGPALTEAEMAQRLEQRRQEQLALQREQEVRRRDAALLARYPTREKHDAFRRASLLQIEELKAAAQQRLNDLHKEKDKLSKELEFYQNDKSQIPPRLQGALQDLERVESEQHAVIQSHNEEAVRISQRFDAELLRLEPMWKPAKFTAQEHTQDER